MALRGWKTLQGHRQLLSSPDRQRTDVQDSAASVQSFERQVVAHPAEIASADTDKIRLKKLVEVAQFPLARSQSALRAVEDACDEYHSRIAINEQRWGVLEALHCSLRSRLVHHTSLLDSVQDFLRQDMDCNLDVYFWGIINAARDHAACFRSAKFNVVESLSAMLRQDVSSILAHLDNLLAASTSKPLAILSSSPLGPGNATPPWKHGA